MSPKKAPGPVRLTGNALERFAEVTVLLSLLDPARGEPDSYGLDQNLSDLASDRERTLKRRFLDSIAMICATQKGGDSVSAACMEEGHPEGTVLRIACNAGIRDVVMDHATEIIRLLNSVASRRVADDTSAAEEDLFTRIVQMNASRLEFYVKKVADGICQHELLSTPRQATPTETPQSTLYRAWLEEFVRLRRLYTEDKTIALPHLVRWAYRIKDHSKMLKKLLNDEAGPQLRKWMGSALKLGRYFVAARVLILLPTEYPALFNTMTIEAIRAPRVEEFTPNAESCSLEAVLKRISGPTVEEDLSYLGRIWNTENPALQFHQACNLKLVTHAEMQLLSYYDNQPERRPSFRFIGVSKKSCYLCHQVLAAHPDTFAVSSCHQRIYPAWASPIAISRQAFVMYKDMFRKLSEKFEKTASSELESRMSAGRRFQLPESTAGFSHWGLVASRISERSDRDGVMLRSQASIRASEDSFTIRSQASVMSDGSQPSLDGSPFSGLTDRTTSGLTDSTIPRRVHDEDTLTPPPSMAFFFQRVGTGRQDIVRIRDIRPISVGQTWWSQLVATLGTAQSVGYQEGGDCLLMNGQMRVHDQRQFLASLQYLDNQGTRSCEVFVQDCTCFEDVTN